MPPALSVPTVSVRTARTGSGAGSDFEQADNTAAARMSVRVGGIFIATGLLND
jgi:hypothetical protein